VKSESEVGENLQLRRSAGKCTPLYLLIAGNGTVPISTWRGLDMLSKTPFTRYNRLSSRLYNRLTTG